MNVVFKNISLNNKGFHKIKFTIEEAKANSDIKSSITIILEETNIAISDPLETIIEQAKEIVIREYTKS